MAITGTFDANFKAFDDAVQNSVVQLRGFEAGAGKVETSLTRMTDNFSGRKIITEATLMAQAVENVGGVSHLTEAELAKVGRTAAEAAEKLRAWGQDVPPGIQRLADTVKEVGAAASGSTGLLSGMANQLAGMFTIGALVNFGRGVLEAGDQIQKMADQTSLGTDEVQKLMYIAGQSGTSIESLVGAVQNLQVRLGDDNSGAAGAMAKLGIHADAFNKLGTYEQMTTLAGAIKDIHDPTEQASVAAALFGKTWKEILPAIKSGMKETGEQATIMADETVKGLDRVGDALKAAHQQATAWGGGVVLAIEGAGFALGDFLSKFNPEHFGVATTELLKIAAASNGPGGVANALIGLLPPILDVGEAFKTMGVSMDEATEIEKKLTASAAESIKVNTAAAEAAKKWAVIMTELTGAGVSWATTLDTMAGQDVEAIKHYLDLGVSQATLATAYAYTAVQIKAVASARADELAAAKSLAEFEDAAAKQEFDIRARMTKATNDAVIATLEARQASDAANAAFLSGALAAAQAQDALNNSIKGVTASYWAEVDAAARAAGVVVIGARPGEGPGINGAPPSGFSLGPGFHLAGGGPVSTGSTYLVGERGPELFTPGASGFISPNGSGGGATVINHIYVNGTADDVARQIADKVLRTVMQTRKLGSA